MVALVAAGLAVAAFVTYEEQRSFLLTRVDQQVRPRWSPSPPAQAARQRPAGRPAAAASGSAARGGGGSRGGRPPVPAGNLRRAARTGRQGAALAGVQLRRQAGPVPSLPGKVPLSRAGQPPHLFTVSTGGRTSYRAAALTVGERTPRRRGTLREADQTLHRLIVVEALVGGGVILALVLLGWLVIRIGLRPLERIGRVASEIAGGDLSRRVTPSDQRTEVGRLGLSLNEMLVRDRAGIRATAARARTGCAASSPTPHMSCARRWPRSAATPSCSGSGRPKTRRRWPGRWRGSRPRRTRMGVLVEDLLCWPARSDARAPTRRRRPRRAGRACHRGHARDSPRSRRPRSAPTSRPRR